MVKDSQRQYLIYILMVLSVHNKAGYLFIKLHFDSSSFDLKLFNTAKNRHFAAVSYINILYVRFLLGQI